jgi:branched-chain amino acid transport system permease protein
MIHAIQIIIGGLLVGSVFAVVALGFSLVFRVTGIVNLAQGAFCIAGALAMYTFQVVFGWPTALAAVAAVALTTIYGLLLGAAIFVPSMDRLPASSMLMITAGLLTFTEGVLLLVWGNEPYASPQFSGNVTLQVLGVTVPTQGLWIVGTALVVILSIGYLLTRTALGTALRACAENPDAARLMGISVARMTILSVGLAAAVGAIGGIVVAPIMSFQFDSGRFLTISGFMAVAIGGFDSLLGAVVGGIILGVAEQLAAGYISSLFSNALALVLLFATLLWRPTGLLVGAVPRRTDVRDGHVIYRPLVTLQTSRAIPLGCGGMALVLALPWLLPDAGLLSSLVICAIFFIAVLGLDILMGYAGQVSLGHAAFMAVGGYTAAILSTKFGIPPLLGIAGGVVLSLLCALVVAALTMHLRGHYFALATLTFGLMVDSLTVGLTEVTGGPSGLTGIPPLSIGSLSFGSPIAMYYLAVGVAAVLAIALLGGVRSSFGRALRAIRTDQTAAAALGIKVHRYKMAAFAISAVLASLAGSLYAFQFRFLSPEMVSTTQSFEMIAMLIIGGEGLLVGSVAGVALLILIPTLFQPLALYKTCAEGLLLVLVFRYLPKGIYGTLIGLLSRIGVRSDNALSLAPVPARGSAR